MRKLAHQQSGNLGEILALAKINSLELAAYSSPDGAPGHDLMVVLEGRTASIEVKTRQFLASPTEITRWPVNMETKGDADFFLFVELDLRTISPTFYLLNSVQAHAIHRNDRSGGNCPPAQVRLQAVPNDFAALV